MLRTLRAGASDLSTDLLLWHSKSVPFRQVLIYMHAVQASGLTAMNHSPRASCLQDWLRRDLRYFLFRVLLDLAISDQREACDLVFRVTFSEDVVNVDAADLKRALPPRRQLEQ